MYKAGSDHGTSCAGVAAGEADGVLTVGAAPACRLLPIKWESQGQSLFISDSKLRRAIDHLADRVDVMSNSWGHVPTNTVGAQVTSRIEQLVSSGGRRGTGIVFLWAAGNDNCPINHTANIPVPYEDGWSEQNGQWVWVGPRTAKVFRNNLADQPGVLHIAALGSSARRAHYSNYGPGIDLCAPTNNNHMYLGQPLGLGVTTTRGTTTMSTTNTFGGTSSATPLVAGIAALVISANAELTAGEVTSILQRTASKDLDLTPWPKTPSNPVMGDTSWDVSPIPPFATGAFTDVGRPDGTWSPWFGHGKVDAAAAVLAAKETTTPPTEPVTWEQTVQGSLAGTGDRDAWVVTFSGTLRVELTGPASADLDLHLNRESPASPVATSKATGPSSHETVEIMALSPERWRITVVSWRGSGTYDLFVRATM
jgi:subtilisin family serine protease